MFWAQNFEFQYFWSFVSKKKFFWVMKILWIIFWGHHKITIFRGHFYAFYVFFLKIKV